MRGAGGGLGGELRQATHELEAQAMAECVSDIGA
jgi:hypothetical protein